MMKKFLCILLIPLLLGCTPKEIPTLETLGNPMEVPVLAEAEISAEIPSELNLVLSSEARSYYIHPEGLYDLTLETVEAENLDALLLETTGFPREALPLLTTEVFGMPRYALSWTGTGENGLRMYRAAILDDGQRYYVAQISADADRYPQCQRQLEEFFRSFGLYGKEEPLSTPNFQKNSENPS